MKSREEIYRQFYADVGTVSTLEILKTLETMYEKVTEIRQAVSVFDDTFKQMQDKCYEGLMKIRTELKDD